MYVLVSIPEKIISTSNEYNCVINTRKFLEKIYKTEYFITPKNLTSKEEKETNAE